MMTTKEFSEATGIPAGTLKRWATQGNEGKQGTLIPAQRSGQGKPSYYSEEQISIAKSLHAKAYDDGNSYSLFDDDSDTAYDAQDAQKDDVAPVYDEIPVGDENNAEIVDNASVAVTIEVEAEIVTLDQRADKIRQLQANVQRDMLSIGFELIAAKKEIGHGGWGKWLETEFKWTQQTANVFMRVAERFGGDDMKDTLKFQPSTLQAMLLLPVGDENNFIDAQEAAGKPVEKQSAREVKRNVKAWNEQHKPKNQPVTEQSHAEDDRVEENIGSNSGSVEDAHGEEFVDAQEAAPEKIPVVGDKKIRGIVDFDDANYAQALFDEIAAMIKTVDARIADDAIKRLKSIRDDLREAKKIQGV